MTEIQTISDKAIEAYKNLNFYKWFYNSRNIGISELSNGNIPYITKHDFMTYENIYSIKYYEDLPDKGDFSLKTNGTSGKSMEMRYKKESSDFVSALEYYIKEILKIEVVNTAVSKNVPEDILNLYRMTKRFSNTWNEIDVKKDINKLIWYINEFQINTIFDVSLEVVRLLGKNSQLVKETSLKYLFYQTMERKNEIALSQAGLSLFSFYVCSELGVLAVRPYGKEQFLVTSCDHIMEVLEDGVIKNRGIGNLIVTGKVGLFPFIRYANGDIVKLIQSNDFTKLILHGREKEVYIPNPNEAKVDYTAIYNYFVNLSFCQEVLLVQYKLNDELNLLATFIEIEGASISIADQYFSLIAMNEGCSLKAEGFVKFFPVIFLPKGMINKFGRSKTFIDLTLNKEHEKWQDYLPLTKILIENNYDICEG